LFEKDEVQVLTDLGLTLRQAKVYLILAKCQDITARNVATASKIPRQDIYKVLNELLGLGLIEKQISKPTKFVAFPINDTCTNLLKRKIEETSTLRIRTKTLMRNLQGIISTKTVDEEPRLFLIPEKEAFTLRIKKSIESSQKSIDIISPKKNLEQGLFFLVDALKKAMQRGVIIRLIVEPQEEDGFQFSFPQVLAENSLFKTRTMPNHMHLRFSVYDEKEITVMLLSDHDFAKSTLLWSDCTSLVDAYQDYFETMWLLKSDPFKIKNHATSSGLTLPS
jgi:sugar-specific transcriptional regulator TrmB